MNPETLLSTFDARRSAVESLADEMVARWHRGERPRTEDYLDRVPDLRDQPEAALELIAEELALREEYGPPATVAELVGRFPKWEAQVRALVQCHRLLGPHAVPRFPSAGDTATAPVGMTRSGSRKK